MSAHHNNLEDFVSRGLKAQAAVDKVIAEHASPAQVATDELAQIASSNDMTWLRRLASDADKQITLRNAANRRLRILAKSKKR